MSGYFAERIRAARVAAGLSQGALAELAGMTQGNVSRLESGRHHVSEGTLELIASALGLTMAELVSWGAVPTPASRAVAAIRAAREKKLKKDTSHP
jgi:transcriptional regulator with XRE-family HTH domain